jgi:citrate synthase
MTMTATNHVCTRDKETGHYEYRGRGIYKTTERSGSYNPWKISLSRYTFPTLAAAKKFIDAREATRDFPATA